jgi:hypothetical protein
MIQTVGELIAPLAAPQLPKDLPYCKHHEVGIVIVDLRKQNGGTSSRDDQALSQLLPNGY